MPYAMGEGVPWSPFFFLTVTQISTSVNACNIRKTTRNLLCKTIISIDKISHILGTIYVRRWRHGISKQIYVIEYNNCLGHKFVSKNDTGHSNKSTSILLISQWDIVSFLIFDIYVEILWLFCLALSDWTIYVILRLAIDAAKQKPIQ